MTDLDFYSGYEGEPELTIRYARDEMILNRIRAWEGYFDMLLEQLVPINGRWIGVAKAYHLDTLWDDDSGWVDSEPADTLRQFMKIDVESQDRRLLEFLEAYCALLTDAVECGGVVTLKRD